MAADGPVVLAAIIAAPPTADGGVMVTIPSLDGGEYRHGPCRGWAPRPDGRDPQRDDPCVIVEDETGGMWIAGWVALDAGDPGGPGDASDRYLLFTQGTASATWTIDHNLGKFPSVTVVDSAGTELIPSKRYTSLNQVVVSFAGATTGAAYLN